jgi:chromosomal replication initiator protein
MFWDGVVRRLGDEVPPFVVDAWVRPLIAKASGDQLRLQCPSALHLERVRARFLGQLKVLAAAEAGRPIEIKLDVVSGTSTTAGTPSTPAIAKPLQKQSTRSQPAESKVSSQGKAPVKRRQARIQTEFPYTFENFVVGSCNQLAREASLAVSRGTQQTVNPLFLASAPGLGKTHLARAITASRIRNDARVIYTSSEAFTNQFTSAIHKKKMSQFKQRFRHDCDLLVVEDVQFLGGKKATQLEFFHTVNHLMDVGARVVLTADCMPGEINSMDEHLRSRMTAGLVATLDFPNALVRREILRAKAARGGVRLPSDCLDRLVDVVRGSARDLEGVLVQLVTTSSLLNRPIDLDLTELALRKITAQREPAQRLEVGAIIEIVAAFYQTTPAALAERSRRQGVMIPRQLAMYLCRRYTRCPASEIARAFARRHPSVTNAEQVIERRMLENAPFRYKVEAITSRLDELERKSSSKKRF